ncbi:MAG TPA: alpha/beta fold hydrolase [Streptosporangiaceae bacterium]|nr:alpha/beta fold hydrolase [Streptosporangiaceae bacterium]
MPSPVVMAKTLVTDDGVPIDAVHLPQESDLAIVIAHGFTFSWQRPAVWRISTRLNRIAGIVSFDFRGHGRSGGLSTLGDRELADLAVAVGYARELGYEQIAAVGFSMGASIVVRYAGLVGGLDAAVSVSGPGRWYYRGTERMRRVHFAAERRIGRLVTRMLTNTRVSPVRWNPTPVPPDEAAAQISPIPLLIVHGDKDLYFPVEHAQRLYEAARDPKELWLVPGFGHAETGCRPALVDRIGRWVATAAGAEIAQARAVVAADAAVGSPAGTAGGAVPEQPPAGDGEDASAQEAAEAAGAAAGADIRPAEMIRAEALEAGAAGTVTGGTPSDGCSGTSP